MKKKDKNNSFASPTSFTYVISVLMKPFSLCLMLAFIVPNYLLFMTYEYELQQSHPSDVQIQKNSLRDIEEPNYIQNLEIVINSDTEINQKYCQNSKCKFLFVFSNSELETRKDIHFIDTFAYLADKLNRTLVLTNVGQSRIDSCKKFPFEFYYNVDYIRGRFPDLQLITQGDFQYWTKERIEKPDFHYVHLSSSSSSFSSSSSSTSSIISNDDELIIIEDINRNNIQLVEDITNCLENFEMKLEDNSTSHQKILFRQDLLLKSFYRKSISNFLIANLGNSDSEILLIKNDVYREIFPKKMSSSNSLVKNPYSEQINQETWRINTDLDPFIAIYWSMTDLKDTNVLSVCVEKLSNTLKDMSERFNLKHVYLATDYSMSLSPTRHRLRHYRRAIDLLNSTMSMTINSWYSLNAFSEVRQDEDNLNEFNGRGVFNMLDKLVCMNSDYFITAPPECCLRPTNNFVRDVVNVRERLFYDYDNNQKIQNIISRW